MLLCFNLIYFCCGRSVFHSAKGLLWPLQSVLWFSIVFVYRYSDERFMKVSEMKVIQFLMLL